MARATRLPGTHPAPKHARPEPSEALTVQTAPPLLIERLRRNERDGLAAAFDAQGAVAYGLALRVVGNPAIAEEVVLESFLQLWRRAPRLDPARGVRSFLLPIVYENARRRVGALDSSASCP